MKTIMSCAQKTRKRSIFRYQLICLNFFTVSLLFSLLFLIILINPENDSAKEQYVINFQHTKVLCEIIIIKFLLQTNKCFVNKNAGIVVNPQHNTSLARAGTTVSKTNFDCHNFSMAFF